MPAPEFQIRAAGDADDEFFREVEFQTTWESLTPADRERLTPEQVREALQTTHEQLLARPGNLVYVAHSANRERAGLLWVGVNRNLVSGQDEFWIYNVTVLPEFRRRGLARLLLKTAEDLARQKGFEMIGLMVSEYNHVARTLYEDAGFQSTNRVMRKPL